MSDIDLHTINQLSKLLSRYKDDVTESGGVIAYSFFIYKSGVDAIIKNYAMQYIHYIYILIFDEVKEKLYCPFDFELISQDDTRLIILYDTNFLSLEEAEFINRLTIINDYIKDNTPNVIDIEYIYNNCFSLIQDHLHYEYNVNIENIESDTITLDGSIIARGKTRQDRASLIAQTQQFLDCILIELLQKLCRGRSMTKNYKKLVCLAITLCYIILYKISKSSVEQSWFWNKLMDERNELSGYINKILHNLTETLVYDLLIQIQHITNSCLQSINIDCNEVSDSRVLSVRTIITALSTIIVYFTTTFNFTDIDFKTFTIILSNIYGDLITVARVINYNQNLLYKLCKTSIKSEDDAYIIALIKCRTLYINFIDEIITVIYLLNNPANMTIDITHIKDKLDHIILINKIFRTRANEAQKIDIITNEYKKNIKNFELNYLSLATKFNSISQSNNQLNLKYTPSKSDNPDVDKLVYGVPIEFTLIETDIIPNTANILNTCGVKETPTLTYENPSYQNLFCYLP
jgi:hypothetical protein